MRFKINVNEDEQECGIRPEARYVIRVKLGRAGQGRAGQGTTKGGMI